MRILASGLAKTKCHLNAGPRECRYLVAAPEGYACGFLDIVLSVKLAALDRIARAGPCGDPYDETSEALPEGVTAIAVGDERRR